MIEVHLRAPGTKEGVSDVSTATPVKRRLPEPLMTQRARRIFDVAQYNWILVPLLYATLFPFMYRLLSDHNNPYFYVPVDDSVAWNRAAFIWILIVLPSKPFEYFALLTTCWPCRPFRLSKKPTIRPFARLLICLVTRGEQEQVVRRSLKSLQYLVPRIHPKVSLHILTEEVNAGKFQGVFEDHVRVHGIPGSYSPRIAKHKARSLEWFRINMSLQDDDWVLHIDEETIVDELCIQKCLDFITKQNQDEMGTGPIHYNIEDSWSTLIPSVGDISRVQDDWGRCQWAPNFLHQAALGIHGSFFLCSGKVENAVGWETAHLTEDYWFLLGAMKKGFRIGWIPAIASEVSPSSIGDFLRQRRRWFTGIRTLGRLEGRLLLFTWLWKFVGLFYGIWRLVAGSSAEPIPRWIFCIIVFEATYFRLTTSLATFIQGWHAGAPWSSIICSQVLAQVIRPYANYLDSCAVALSLIAPEKGFYIVRKG